MRAAAALLVVAVLGGCQDGSPVAQKERLYTFRAIGGASMGAMAAAQLGLRHHEYFDIIAPSGGGLDMAMLVQWFRDGVLGGFCVPPQLGQMCRNPGQNQDYEHIDCGGPNGGGFDREDFIQNFQDMFIAYGNLALFNPKNPYLPPGMSPDYFQLDRQERCSQPVRLEKFYDWRFNPDGTHTVITYCEADGPEQGVFDPQVSPHYPVDILLAVDLNNNGRRDSGEPVLFQLSERFEDTGEDGLLSMDEAGYDPVKNPDPHGDDFHPWNNPFGTEKNNLFDSGEPFLDYGLDGVPGTATSPYDWGERNGLFDYNPHVMRTAIMFDPSMLLKNMSRQQLDRLDFYIDVGIRDHLGFRQSSEAFAGKLAGQGRKVDLRYGYESIMQPGHQDSYDIHYIDWPAVGRDLMIIYGKADATQEEIDAGDGGHIGTPAQAVQRFFTMMAFVSSRWPDGDFDRLSPSRPSQTLNESYYSEILGMERRYIIYLPPGYQDNQDQYYPALFLLHGIGMGVDDLTAAAVFADPWMNEGLLQKFIMVFPDGRCTDDCHSGTFYANQMGGWKLPRRYEDSFFQELIPDIEKKYRLRRPQSFVLENGYWSPGE